MKRLIAFLLALSMVLSMAACGAPAQPQEKPDDAALQQDNTDQLDRQDKELVAELIGGQDASDLTDAELDAMVDQLIGETEKEAGVVNLSTQKTEPKVEFTSDPDVYDENGAMTEPFDQVYPELIEKGQVAFSGESILIKLKSGKLTDGLKAAGIGALEEIVPMEKASWYEAKLTEGTDPKTAIENVRQLKEVMLAEYNYEIQTAALDDYKHFDKEQEEDFKKNGHNKDQWHFHYCGIPDGYREMETEGGKPTVIVAVIDSGVDYTHEDLKDNMWVNKKEIPDNGRDDDGNGYVDDYYGVDIITGSGSGNDTNGHGTHVAGIVAAKNNNVGTLGIAYNVRIMSVKAANHSGYLNQADIAKAVLYAYENGAEVINMSFGGITCSIAVQDALATAYTRCVLVASAGNNGAKNQGPGAIPNYPACLTYVLGVMSVDQYGHLSRFSNYDSIPYNGVEYEVYALGENIMSTLPGNKYGYLSGTSMAAPMVSAFAAILRSEYSDRDMYPTKFIYGQLAATSDYYGDDGAHQIVNLEAALTKLPKPDVTYQDYRLFDDPKYSEKNNGDGVIDAGETIALGFTLHNRWGMSENTLVTIDTKSAITGLDDPYITIHNPTVNYDSIGTYSTGDCGKTWTDELWTGWEDPFMITVSEDCPNDYRFNLHITITCENALDAEDDTVYSSDATLTEAVRAGYIVPAIIEEDMVWTKDTLYIIPNGTMIKEGVTVRVEPGTHIQFWTDDPNDTYADKYVAYLLVNGDFLVEGTKEEPIMIYPSQLMEHYNVEIAEGYEGYISLKYADITNFAYYRSSYGSPNTNQNNNISLAERCTFRMAHGDLIGRYVSGGGVSEWKFPSTDAVYLGQINAKDCVFYKLAGFYYNGYNLRTQQLKLNGVDAERCIFVECGIEYMAGSYRDCVFLKNHYVNQMYPDAYVRSSRSTAYHSNIGEINALAYRKETGTYYLQVSASYAAMQKYLEQLGAKPLVVETREELQWIWENCRNFGYTKLLDTKYDEATGKHVWSDGTPITVLPDQYDVLPQLGRGDKLAMDLNYGDTFSDSSINLYRNSSYASYTLYELPGQILPEEITFRAYEILMDPETTWQLEPVSKPAQLPAECFLYESSDETVLTVSETGLVTPVGLGTADVWVYSMDRAVKNRVTVTVRERVPLESISVAADQLMLPVGETAAVGARVLPADTTRNHIVYRSSNEAVAVVDADGNITGIASGTAVITAQCEGVEKSTQVTVYRKTAALELSTLTMLVSLDGAPAQLPTVTTEEGAETILSWRSTDETVATVENGEIIPHKNGTTTLVVTDQYSQMTASCMVLVQEAAASPVKQMATNSYLYLTLLENGDLYCWGSNYSNQPSRIMTGIAHVAVPNSGGTTNVFAVVLEDGTIQEIRLYADTNSEGGKTISVVVWDAQKHFAAGQIAEFKFSYTGTGDYYVRTVQGNCYAWGGSNDYGQLGIGNYMTAAKPVLINLDGVVEMAAMDCSMTFLTSSGELYGVGNVVGTAVPTLLDTGVVRLLGNDSSQVYYIKTNGGRWNIPVYSGVPDDEGYCTDALTMDQVIMNGYDTGRIGIRDGKVYKIEGAWYYETREIPGITDAIGIYASAWGNTVYIATAGGLLYGMGANQNFSLAGMTNLNQVTEPLLIPLEPLPAEMVTVTADNLTDGVLTEESLRVTFNKSLLQASPKLYADRLQVTVKNRITAVNGLEISRSMGFSAGVNYELVYEPGTIICAGNITNPEEIRIAFTFDGVVEEVIERVVYASSLDESVERYLTKAKLQQMLEEYQTTYQLNPEFYGNAILNPISTDDIVDKWLRFQAPNVGAGSYTEIRFGGNYWGSTNQRAIELQMIDYTDFANYARLVYSPFLTEAPENTFPFVTSVKLFNKDGDEVKTVGNEQVTFRVTFNRDMDTSIPLQFRFGSAYPYGDYEVAGQYVDARTWEGTYTLKTIIENGNQFITIENGCSATEDLGLQLDRGRFGFVIDTTAAQALIMQGTATDTGIELRWTQDDFDTLMGYNVYRSTAEDGLYTRVNPITVPADTMTFFDNTVEPGKVYYYNFTVVKTDLTESEPSGKIVIMSKDTMAPDIYHSPVVNAFAGENLVISATVTDNLNIAYTNLYYRTAGTENWTLVRMNKLNDKYSAIVHGEYVQMDGLEYYLEAFDGVSFTYKGTADAPYTVQVQESIDLNALGDVDGDGIITNLDALKLLYAINDKYNMTAEEFARADLNGDGELWAAEALRILQYVSGAVGSVKM